jgi:anti-sigma regulatory factor (Ser/Thr protein kinase)
MQTEPLKAPDTTTFERSYPGTVFYVRRVRADLAPLVERYPFADDLVLLASELAANAIIHTRSHEPDGEITVRAQIRPGDAWVEIVDQGGPWIAHEHDDDRPHGLDIVARLAGDGNWGIDGDDACRVAWFRLDWPAEP